MSTPDNDLILLLTYNNETAWNFLAFKSSLGMIYWTDLWEIISALTCHSPFIYGPCWSTPTGVSQSFYMQNNICQNFPHSSQVHSFQVHVSHALTSSKPFSLQIPFCVPIWSLQVINNDHNLNSTHALIFIRHPSDMQELTWMPVLRFFLNFLFKFFF